MWLPLCAFMMCSQNMLSLWLPNMSFSVRSPSPSLCGSHCMGQTVWVKLCWSLCVGQIVWVILCRSYCVGHIVWVTLCGSNYVGHNVLVTMCGSQCVGLICVICDVLNKCDQFCHLCQGGKGSLSSRLVNWFKYCNAHGYATSKNQLTKTTTLKQIIKKDINNQLKTC